MPDYAVSSPKAKHIPLVGLIPFCSPLQRNCLFILAVNWVMQGMRGMQSKELSFRLILEAMVASVMFWLVLWIISSPISAACFALFVAHSLNFLFNGQFWVCARYCQSYHGNADHVEESLSKISNDLGAEAWLNEAAIIGSRAKTNHRLHDRSDIDLRLIFPKGFAAWIKTNLLLLTMRSWALIHAIPLDLYAYDEPKALERFDQSEPLGLLLDRQNRLARHFVHSRTLTRI